MNSKIGIIIQREYYNKVTKKSFILLTFLIPILVVMVMFISYWLSGMTTEPEAATPMQTEVSAENIGFLFTVIIYMFIFTYGGMVMHSVKEEKSNRVIEIIISSVKPFELMIGKIIAVGLVGITQFILWLILIVGFCSFGQYFGGNAAVVDPFVQNELLENAVVGQQIPDLFQAVNGSEILLYFLIFFVGGYMLYASIFASIGALIDSQEDTQQFMLPVTLLLLAVFFIAIFSMKDPHGELAVWASIIPFSSPVVMMVRLPFEVPLWQKLLSVALLYVTFVLFIHLSAKIYRIAILIYGKKPTFGELFKNFKMNNE